MGDSTIRKSAALGIPVGRRSSNTCLFVMIDCGLMIDSGRASAHAEAGVEWMRRGDALRLAATGPVSLAEAAESGLAGETFSSEHAVHRHR